MLDREHPFAVNVGLSQLLSQFAFLGFAAAEGKKKKKRRDMSYLNTSWKKQCFYPLVPFERGNKVDFMGLSPYDTLGHPRMFFSPGG